jgi:hypothetical protein
MKARDGAKMGSERCNFFVIGHDYCIMLYL